ncbi:MAG: hypothetical protein ACOCT9_00870 [archaeon]
MLDEEKIVDYIESLKRRLDECIAIIKSGEAPFVHLSLIKSEITYIMREISKI